MHITVLDSIYKIVLLLVIHLLLTAMLENDLSIIVTTYYFSTCPSNVVMMTDESICVDFAQCGLNNEVHCGKSILY